MPGITYSTEPVYDKQGNLKGFLMHTYRPVAPTPPQTPPVRNDTATLPPVPVEPGEPPMVLTAKQMTGLLLMRQSVGVPQPPDVLGQVVDMQRARGMR